MNGIRLIMLIAFYAIGIACAGVEPGRAQSCSATITDVDFGSPSGLQTAPVDALATLTVACSHIPALTVVKVCPAIGRGSAGSMGGVRLMSSGGSTLTYQLYQDANRTQGWGSWDQTELGTVPVLTIGTGFTSAATVTRSIYARLFGGQTTASPGAYASSFTSLDTNFTYAPHLAGTLLGCTGLLGAGVLHPTFMVRATPQANCTVTTGDLDFGVAGVLSSARDGQSAVRITCSRNTPYAIGLSGGAANAGANGRRLTSSGGGSVAYNLYRDAARSQIWGDTSGARTTGTGTGVLETIPVYGRVPPQTTPPPGIYSDTIIATVTY